MFVPNKDEMKSVLSKILLLITVVAVPPNAYANGLDNTVLCKTEGASLAEKMSLCLDQSKRAYVSDIDKSNMVNYDIQSKTVSYESFDAGWYEQRDMNSIGDGESRCTASSKTFFDLDPSLLAGTRTSGKTKVENPKSWPYQAIAFVDAVFHNVYNKRTGRYETAHNYGTGFLEGPNLLVSAGHCVFFDITSGYEYDDGVNNRRFPDAIFVYAGVDGRYELSHEYGYTAEVSVINIETKYYKNESFGYDWCALKLNRSLGNEVGYYGKISNWFVDDEHVYTYGYPTTPGCVMFEAHGAVVGKSERCYAFDFDAADGQSGSPVFMIGSEGDAYVCGIFTHGSRYDSDLNGGTIINSFIYNYLDSFVTSKKSPITLKVASKSGDYWNIRLFNRGGEVLTVFYNEKMCFLDDAKYWRNLRNVKSIEVQPYLFTHISIKTNFFATAITTSIIAGKTRFVTYADNLSASGSLRQYHHSFGI
ncbi:MAG: hypothetical protein J6328_04375 [Bacilli bacterium]|nr:hypothetical protein [Bacilli bacterium]